MERTRLLARIGSRCLVLGAAALSVSLTAAPAISADGIDPEADKILKSMSAYLSNVSAFTVNTDIDFEIVAKSGQKVQLSSFARVTLQRPGKLLIQRKGMIADAELMFDGKTLTLYGKNLNAYAQANVPGTIDDAIRAYEQETGIPAPGADLLFSDTYATLSPGVTSSAYLGMAYVNGVQCHHLAFREDKVDWQLWVQTGVRPLPRKYVITSKWQTAAPQYEIRFRDWVTNPQINANQFTFAVPPKATKLDSLAVADLDKLTSIEEEQ